jgi:hypothetical protein
METLAAGFEKQSGLRYNSSKEDGKQAAAGKQLLFNTKVH